jgi:peptidyl-prolyl cis-trans isomerase A (cyclophilin A)
MGAQRWRRTVATLAVWACSMAVGALRPAVADLPKVLLVTDKGNITIAVDLVHAPRTAANFLHYVDANLFRGGRFHRTVRPGTEANTADPIQIIQATRAPRTAGFPAIPLETTKATGLKHVDGTVSMARSGTNTATSDFFICIGNQPALDFGGTRSPDRQGYAAFGRVVAGMDVVRAIQAAPVYPGSQTLSPVITIQSATRIK